MIEIYTDGSCIKNNYGGYGVVIYKYGKLIDCYAKREENTTNNICELKAILYALVKYGLYNPTPTVYSDSAYAINSLTVWRHTWKDKGWNRYDGGTIKNLELIQAFDELEEKGFKINLIKVKGHDTVEGNILADKLATGKILPEDILNKK